MGLGFINHQHTFPIIEEYLKGRDVTKYAQPTTYLITSGRRTGNTTRAADNVIQLLFKERIVFCTDDFEGGANKNANRNLLNVVVNRLKFEHAIEDNQIKIVYLSFIPIIQLKQVTHVK